MKNSWVVPKVLTRFFFLIPKILVVFILKLYRKFISPLYGDVCKYFPSCSAYALEAVIVHGVIKGLWLSFKRIIRCNPFSQGGVDHVPQGRKQWVEGEKKPEILVLNHPVVFSNSYE